MPDQTDRDALIQRCVGAMIQAVMTGRDDAPLSDVRVDGIKAVLALLESEDRLCQPLDPPPGMGEHLVHYEWWARDTTKWTPLTMMTEEQAREAVRTAEPGSMILVRRSVDIGPWEEVTP